MRAAGPHYARCEGGRRPFGRASGVVVGLARSPDTSALDMALTTRARAAFALGAILALVSLASGADARETSPEIRLSEGAARRLLAAHQYRMRDKVPLYANKAGPFHNPSEVRRALVSRALSGGRPIRFRRRVAVASARGTFVPSPGRLSLTAPHPPASQTYQYYDLPFCEPEDGAASKIEDLGEVLEGDRMTSTPYDVPFRVDKDNESLCRKTLGAKDLKKFRKAVKDDYYFQMYYDDLPIWGFIGKIEKILKPGAPEMRYYLFTHVHFDISYNRDRVVEINVSTDPLRTVDITEGESVNVEFSYSVKWKETHIPYERRMEKYSRYSFLPQHLEIHWFSIINSCVTVLLLTGFLATILMRVLKNDFIKVHARRRDGGGAGGDWMKYIHGDVFRFPRNVSLFCAVIGTGTQLFRDDDGCSRWRSSGCSTRTTAARCSPHASSSTHSPVVSPGTSLRTTTARWAERTGFCNVLLTGFLFCGPLFMVFAFLNTVAIAYRSTAALPFGTICIILIIWALVTFPLTVLGGIAGKNAKTEFNAPCRTTKYPARSRHSRGIAAPSRRCAWRASPFQRHLHRAVLHIRVRVGSQGVHHLQHPLHRVHHPRHRDGVHHHRAHVLPARRRGSRVVVALRAVRRVHRSVHLRGTASTTTTPGPTCPDSCRRASSSDTCSPSATGSS